MLHIVGKLIILNFRKSTLESLKVSLVKVIVLFRRASVFRKLILLKNQVLLLCNFSTLKHEIRKIFDTFSISTF